MLLLRWISKPVKTTACVPGRRGRDEVEIHAQGEEDMISAYVPILILSLVAGGFAASNILVTFVVGPYRPTREKLSPYESGMTEIKPPRERFPIKFYVIAMLFLLFDIEAVSFYPWAVLLRPLHFAGFVEMFIFLIILSVGFIYVWRKGALDWE
jgi:NADH-quinone oxidoreductase subunit A